LATAGLAALSLLASATAATAATQTVTTAGETQFTVPAGVTSLQVRAIGGSGGNAISGGGSVMQSGGQGRLVTATIPVTPGEVLWLEVGADGRNGRGLAGAGGGGATDVRTCSAAAASCASGGTTLQSRLLIAGGGGGAGGSSAGGEGADSDEVGADGTGSPGSGGDTGTTNDGGQGGGGTSNPGATGTLGAGGAGGQGPAANTGAGAGGAGGGGAGGATDGTLSGGGGAGGGYYGGGGGAGSSMADPGGGGGGGGGASYVTPAGQNTQLSWTSSAPSITLTYTPTPAPLPISLPTVTSVAPASGTTAGGQVVTITGVNYGSTRQVYFGVVAAPRFQVLGFNTISAVTPPGAAGPVDVRVVNPLGLPSQTNAGDVFTYLAAPAPPPAPAPGPAPAPTPAPAPAPQICVVPNTLDGTYAAARRALVRAHCALGTVTGRTRRHGRVVLVTRQSIPPGTHLLPGDRIALRLRAYRAG
jgi:hypothetical protein